MAPHTTANYRTAFICVDNDPEAVPGQAHNNPLSNSPHHVEDSCDGFTLPMTRRRKSHVSYALADF